MDCQLDISDDGFLSLMNDDGDTKDDVKIPDGDIGDKINKLFKVDEKDTSKSPRCPVVMLSAPLPPCGHGRACWFRGANLDCADVVILTAMGEEAAIEAKEAPRQA